VYTVLDILPSTWRADPCARHRCSSRTSCPLGRDPRRRARAAPRKRTRAPAASLISPRSPPGAEVEADDLLGRDPARRRVHSSMYTDLRTNLPREVMGFSDFPDVPAALGGRSADARRFPAHTEVDARRRLALCPTARGLHDEVAGRLRGIAVPLLQ